MAKGDDALARKKNKSNRKKMNRKNDSATVSSRVASLIAAKKRRKSGKRSMCQGMCFSLPTPEDPFNEGKSKVSITKKKTKKFEKKRKGEEKKLSSSPMSIECPSRFMRLCLNTIDSWCCDDADSMYADKSLVSSTWGFEFWKCFCSGIDVLDTSGMSSTLEQIAWIVSTAADAMLKQEKEKPEEESSSDSPFLLFLVPSQSKASRVRSVCKALKSFVEIHSVSLHEGASIDHQINGLKTVEPEFLISTPERLLEIVNLKGIDISGVSLLVVDELDSLCTSGYLDAVKSIKEEISSKHRSIVFSDKVRASGRAAVRSLLGKSVKRLALGDSVASQDSHVIKS